MVEQNTTVDVLSLEDFHATLERRLTEANSLLTTLNTSLRDSRPKLGDFQDATTTATRHHDLHAEHVAGVQRLIDAITATQAATATIMNNYRTTEARNTANATDIANIMRPVGEVLNGGQTHGR